MKKVLSLLILFLTVFTINIKALDIDIINVEAIDKSELVNEVNNNTINKDIINFNINFKDFEQYITYKVTLKNNTKDDLNYDLRSKSEYMNYELLEEDKTIKSNNTKEVLLKVSYINEIDKSLYVDDKYNIQDNLELVLTGESVKGVLENPKTGVFTHSILITLLIVLGVILYLRLSERRLFKFYVFILLFIPIIVYASTYSITIKININLEIDRPKVGILGVGQDVNNALRSLAGDSGDNINEIKLSKGNESTDGIEVQSEDSEYKIYATYNDGVITLSSMANRIEFNKNSDKFYSNMHNLQTIEYPRGHYIESAVKMFYEVGLYHVGDISLDLSTFDGTNIKNMSEMFSYFGDRTNGNITINFGDNFNAKSATSTANMFNNLGYNSTGSIYINLGNNFNAESVENANQMFYYIGYGKQSNIIINLGDNFNLKNATGINQMFYGIGQGDSTSHPNVEINLGDNFNAESAEGAYNMFYMTGYYSSNLKIDLGKNANLKSVQNMAYGFGCVGGYGGNVDINLGDNFNAESLPTIYSLFGSTANDATGIININLGKNANFKSVTSIQYFIGSVGKKSPKVTIDFGDNANFKNVKNVQSMMSSVHAGNGELIINYGKNLNFESLEGWSSNFMSDMQARVHASIDFGDNANFKNLKSAQYLITGFGYENYLLNGIDIDLGENFGGQELLTINMFIQVYRVTGKVNIDFGDEFDTSKVTTMRQLLDINNYQNISELNIYYGKKFTTENVQNLLLPSISSTVPIIVDFTNIDLSSLSNPATLDMYYGNSNSKVKYKFKNKTYNIVNHDFNIRELLTYVLQRRNDEDRFDELFIIED